MITRHSNHEPHAYRPSSKPGGAGAPRLSTLDLNLLLIFDVLYSERSVTRAGNRLGLTQSAVSHALGRLRERLGDDLFVRTPDGMVPTARARAVAPQVHASL